MSAKWAPGHSKTVMSRLKTHVFPLIGARAIVDLDTHDLMQPLETIKKRGTIDVALRVQNYLQSIMREAKRLRLMRQPCIRPRRLDQSPAGGTSPRSTLIATAGTTGADRPLPYKGAHLPA